MQSNLTCCCAVTYLIFLSLIDSVMETSIFSLTVVTQALLCCLGAHPCPTGVAPLQSSQVSVNAFQE